MIGGPPGARRPRPRTCGCGCTCSSHRLVAPAHDRHGRRLRAAHQRRVDQRRAVRGRGLRGRPGRGCRPAGPVMVYGVDKFPRMVDYVLPDRRADRRRRPGPPRRPPGRRAPPSCTRGSSTTTPARSARRWSRAGSRPAWSSATDSDVGGGASIMGTLSGGGKEVVSIGERCLLGRQRRRRHLARRRLRGRGRLLRHGRHQGHPARRHAWSRPSSCPGSDHVLFRRNSVTGAIEAVPWKAGRIELNAALHAN